MLGAGGIRRQVGQVDLGLHRGGKFDLCFFGSLLQTLQGLAVIVQVDAIILFELLDQIIHNAQVEVIAAEEGIAARGTDLKHTVAHIQNGNIKRTAAQIIDGNNFIFLFIQTIRQGGSGRLVDDAQHFQARRSCRHPWWRCAGHR